MLRGWGRTSRRGVAALLMLAGLLLTAVPAPAAVMHAAAGNTVVAAGAAQAGAPQSPCQPGEPHGAPCCQASACATLAAPAPTAQAASAPAERGVIAFAPLRSQLMAGIAPHPGMRPPRAAV